jgi:hypothetical protein
MGHLRTVMPMENPEMSIKALKFAYESRGDTANLEKRPLMSVLNIILSN